MLHVAAGHIFAGALHGGARFINGVSRAELCPRGVEPGEMGHKHESLSSTYSRSPRTSKGILLRLQRRENRLDLQERGFALTDGSTRGAYIRLRACRFLRLYPEVQVHHQLPIEVSHPIAIFCNIALQCRGSISILLLSTFLLGTAVVPFPRKCRDA